MNGPWDKFKQHHFEFAKKDTLLERQNKDNQCLGNSLVVYISILYNHVDCLLTYTQQEIVCGGTCHVTIAIKCALR